MKLKSAVIGVTVFLLMAPSLSLAQNAAKGSEPATTETITVDLAKDTGPVTYRASGFLHGISTTTPPMELIEPLKPKLFRHRAYEWRNADAGAFPTYEMVKKLGAHSQVGVASTTHGYSLAGWWPGDNGEWKRWEDLVAGLVTDAKKRGLKFEWDIWNEPDHNYFWGRSREQFFETWKRGYLKIREIEPDATIVGPSITWYKRDFMEAFLLYAKENSVLPNILCWHELGKYDNILDHVAQAKDFMARNDIKIERITLNEIIGGTHVANPGATTHFLAKVDRSGVESAAHACWGDDNCSACENLSLDGLLTNPDKKPRAPWWVYKGYADVTGRLVYMEAPKAFDGVAGKDDKLRQIRMLLGRDGGEAGSVDVSIKNLKSAPYLKGKVRVIAERIPPTGWKPLPRMLTTINQDVEIKDGELRVTLPSFGPTDAYVLTIKALPGGSQ